MNRNQHFFQLILIQGGGSEGFVSTNASFVSMSPGGVFYISAYALACTTCAASTSIYLYLYLYLDTSLVLCPHRSLHLLKTCLVFCDTNVQITETCVFSKRRDADFLSIVLCDTRVNNGNTEGCSLM